MNINARILKENRLRKAKAEKQINEKQTNKRIARSLDRTCSGVQISIMDIPAIFRIVRVAMALTPECSDEALDRLVAATVESYRRTETLSVLEWPSDKPPGIDHPGRMVRLSTAMLTKCEPWARIGPRTGAPPGIAIRTAMEAGRVTVRKPCGRIIAATQPRWAANMPRDRTDEFATLPRGQRAAAISNARVDRARAAAAEMLRATFKQEQARRLPPINIPQSDTQHVSWWRRSRTTA